MSTANSARIGIYPNPGRNRPKISNYRPSRWPEFASDQSVPTIAYTYSEPTIFYEYMYDIAEAGAQEINPIRYDNRRIY